MNNFRLFIIIAIGLAIFFIFGSGFVVYGLYQFFVPLGGTETKIVVVAKGEGVRQIASNLKAQDLIRSPFWFEAYVWLEHTQNKLQAGEYYISQGSSTAEVASAFFEGKIFENSVWVTIPEGFTLHEIETRLKEGGLVAGENLSSQKIESFSGNYEFLKNMPQKANLEGFLFPDTYKFDKEVAQREILQKMLDNFESQVTEKMRFDIASQGRTLFEIVTMASIIEKEVKTPSDRRMVSGIFWQRLKNSYPLQSDATLSYIFGDKIAMHTFEQTKIDSPYNTYRYIGLPPGPINNPGLDAIEAAIYPQKSDYYFFITKPDTGEAVFAKTLQEQNANVVKYLK